MPNNEEVTLKNGIRALKGTVRITVMTLDALWDENPLILGVLTMNARNNQPLSENNEYFDILLESGLIDIFGRVPEIVGQVLFSGMKDDIWTGDPIDHSNRG